MAAIEQLYSEIDDPKTRTKLQAIQGFVTDLDKEQLRAKEASLANLTSAETAKIISKRITAEMATVQNQIDKGNLDPAEAKIRISQIQRIVAVVDDLERGWRSDAATLQGKAQGLEAAVKVGGQRFDAERGKWERHKRMAEEEEQERKELYQEPEAVTKPKAKKAPPKKAKKKTPVKKPVKRKAKR